MSTPEARQEDSSIGAGTATAGAAAAGDAAAGDAAAGTASAGDASTQGAARPSASGLLRSLGPRAGELVAAALLGAVVSMLALLIVGIPTFVQPSYLPQTVNSVVAALLVFAIAYLLLRSRPQPTGDRTLWGVGVVTPAVLAGTHLGFVLHGTPHYLFGLGGDQLNRVPMVGRFADSPQLADVFYADGAPFYPAGWFWVGGRIADFAGVEPWRVYKPFSIATMAVAGSLAFVLWRWVVAPRLAVVIAAVSTMVGLHHNAYEPYSWLLVAALPVVVIGVFAVCDSVETGSASAWPLTVGIGVYLGWAALSYTLLAGFAAAGVGVLMLTVAWRALRRGETGAARGVVIHLATMAAISIVLALLFWWRYLAAFFSSAPPGESVASSFAPEMAATWPLPMFELSATGLLCLLGTGWLIMRLWPTTEAGGSDPARARHDLVARGLAVLTIAVLIWYLVSGVVALAGSTLLPFRLIPVLTTTLAVAGIFGAVALVQWVLRLDVIPAVRKPAIRVIAIVLALLAAVQMTQHVSEENREFAEVARDTPPPPENLLAVLDTMAPPDAASEHVILTTMPTLLAYRPFFSYQAPTQAYASPGGRYEDRSEEITRWSLAESTEELLTMLDSGAFRPPDLFLLNAPGGADYFVYRRVDNTMPRTDNNEARELRFDRELFDDPAAFEVQEIGGRVVIARR